RRLQRGRGVSQSQRCLDGTEQLDLHLRWLADLGARTVLLEVGEDNEPAHRLYHAAGFREVTRRKAYYQERDGRGHRRAPPPLRFVTRDDGVGCAKSPSEVLDASTQPQGRFSGRSRG